MILVDVRDGRAHLTLNNPARKNAITFEMADRIERFCDMVDTDETIGAVIVDASGDYFCSGADTRDLAEWSANPVTTATMNRMSSIYSAFIRVGCLPVPTVAVVTGGAVGAGLNLALAADLLLVTPDAVLESGFVARGIHPGGGHFSLLGRSLNRQQSIAMGTLGLPVSAKRAIELGLAWEVCPPETIRERADEIVASAAQDPLLARRVKTSAVLELGPGAVSWRAAVELERGAQMWSFTRKGEAGPRVR